MAYKLVMKRLKCNSKQPLSKELLQNIVNTLFPTQPDLIPARTSLRNTINFSPVTEDEVIEVVKKFGVNKAPGPDGIPNIALKLAARTQPDMFADLYNSCLKEGIFPAPWKQQRLVLIPKGSKHPNDLLAQRPLCMLDNMGKLLERLICNRLETAIEQAGGLANHQYGFRKARSTIDAIKEVVNTAQNAIEGKRWKHGTKKYCLIVALDVKNAFNTANWNSILKALCKFKVPEYLLNLIRDYFKNRLLLYESEEGKERISVTGGVPQGSVLGPLLWNVMYDHVFNIEFPSDTKIVGYADDVAIVVVAKHIDEAVEKAEIAAERIMSWLTSVGLSLAAHKTEALLITSRKRLKL